MKGLLVVNHGLLVPKFNEIHEMLIAAFRRRGVTLEKRTNAELLIRIGAQKPSYAFALFYDKDVALCAHLENTGIPVFNSAKSIALCDDKGLTALALEGRIPMPKQVLSPLLFFGRLSEDYLHAVLRELGLPVVVKAAKGSFGEQICLVRSEAELVSRAEEWGAQPVVFQEYCEAHGSDIRLYVIGGKVVAGLRRTAREGEFRANLSIGGSMEPYTPTAREAELAIRACSILGTDFAGVDLLAGDKPLLLEVNSNAHFKNLYDCTGYNFAEDIADYILGRLT